MNREQDKTPSIFRQEVNRDWNTFRRLDFKRKMRFLWDYFRFKIIAAIVIVVVVVSAGIALYHGQQPCRLQVCVVLNNEMRCQSWFDGFFDELQADGNKARCDLNEDQPFDYHNKYYYVQELEVMTTISSQRMDVAVCGPDMYEYVLALNACMPLDTALSDSTMKSLEDKGMLVTSTAGLRYNDDGTLDESDAVDGIFAIDITNTEFGHEYNDKQKLEDGETNAPLYAIIITNTEHTEDSVKLIEALIK